MRTVRFHPKVQQDIDDALLYYDNISESLADGFWCELQKAFQLIERYPERYHFDKCGLRRFNLKRFPYHLLYLILPDRIRIQVIRHNQRHPRYGRGR